MRPRWLILLAARWVLPAGAQEAPESAPVNPLIVAEIHVKGSENLDSLIEGMFAQKTYFATKVGEEVSQENLSADIRRIFTDYGPFADIQVDATPTSQGLRLTFLLTEYPRVQGNLELVGNKELSYNKLRKLFTLKEGERFSDNELWKTRQAILDEYRKQGFYFAEVNPKVTPVEGQNAVRVSLEIKEGERVKVVAVRFVGNQLLEEKKLRRVIKTKKGKRFDEATFREDQNVLLDALHDEGLLNARIVQATQTYDDRLKGLLVTFEIEEGAQFIFDGYDISIEEQKPTLSESRIRKELQLSPGDIFKKTTYLEDVERVRELYANHGNILAEVIPDIVPDTANETVKGVLHIVEGSTITIHDIRVEGLTKTKPFVILRELKRLDLAPGKPMKASNLQKVHQNIVQLGSFIQGLQFIPVSTDDEKQKDLVVQVKESPRTGLFTIGGGYGSESGLFGTAEIGESNLLGRAYRLSVRGEIGQREHRIGQIVFGTPWLLGTPTALNVQLYSVNQRRYLYSYADYRRSSDNMYDDFRRGASLTLRAPLTRDVLATATFRDETVEASYQTVDVTDDQPYILGARETRSLGAGLTRDTRRYRTSLFEPNGGGEISLFFEHSGGTLGGQNAFRKYTFETSRFIDTWKRLVLALHFRAGYLQDRSGIHPRYLFYERYWLGGIDTVRGYPDFSLVPSKPGTVVLKGTPVTVLPNIGGNQMFYFNAEYRVPINQQIRGLAFFDAGQVWNEGTTHPLKDLAPLVSVGVGVRLEIAAGFLIRLEYGVPLTSVPYYNPSGKRVERRTFSPRLHFSLGPAF